MKGLKLIHILVVYLKKLRSSLLNIDCIDKVKQTNSQNTSSMWVMCNMLEENMDHFISCLAYGKSRNEINWKDIFEKDSEKQNSMALEISRRD